MIGLLLRRRFLGRRTTSERGSLTVELAIVFPVFLLLLFSCVQVAMWWHARNVCLAAAEAGVQSGRVRFAELSQAEESAKEFVRSTGAHVVTNPNIHAWKKGHSITVQVKGSAKRVVPFPGLRLPVSQTARGGQEEFTTP